MGFQHGNPRVVVDSVDSVDSVDHHKTRSGNPQQVPSSTTLTLAQKLKSFDFDLYWKNLRFRWGVLAKPKNGHIT